MKNVLIINQSAELYGADKALLELIENYPKGYNPIVVLHEDGPLKDLLESKKIKVIKCSVIKVKRGILKPLYLLNLPFEILKSFKIIRKELEGKKISLIHSNATSVFIGAFYSFFFRIPHLWHVHEIIEKPKKIALIYPRLINFFANRVIFNSLSTQTHFLSIYPKIKKKSVLIYNGQQRIKPITSMEETSKIRSSFTMDHEKKIFIGLIGRISKIKGQHLLLDSFVHLSKTHPEIQLIFIGSVVKGKERYLKNIWSKIETESLIKKVNILEFQENIWPFYDSMDIIIVPSTEKESFGLVATEAMLSKKPLIVAGHGGLSEIVIDNETGLHFEPNNAIDLSKKIQLLLNNPALMSIYGENGLNRVKNTFSTKKYVTGVVNEYDNLTM